MTTSKASRDHANVEQFDTMAKREFRFKLHSSDKLMLDACQCCIDSARISIVLEHGVVDTCSYTRILVGRSLLRDSCVG